MKHITITHSQVFMTLMTILIDSFKGRGRKQLSKNALF